MSEDEVFRALADASRRTLLDRLQQRSGQTLNELCAALDMTRQAVSKHLWILENANLISVQRRGHFPGARRSVIAWRQRAEPAERGQDPLAGGAGRVQRES